MLEESQAPGHPQVVGSEVRVLVVAHPGEKV